MGSTAQQWLGADWLIAARIEGPVGKQRSLERRLWGKSASRSSLTVSRLPAIQRHPTGVNPMPMTHLHDTDIFYLEVGSGLPCLVSMAA